MFCCAGRKTLATKRLQFSTMDAEEQQILKTACAKTKFGINEVLANYQHFLSFVDAKDKLQGIKKEIFIEKTKMLNNSWSEKLAARIFDTIEKKVPTHVNFTEFLCYLDLLFNGSPADKLKFSFRTLDIESKGYLTREDLHVVLEILLQIQAVLSGDPQPTSYSLSTIVEYIMGQYDTNQDGQIDWSEFSRTSLMRKDLLNLFEVLGGSLKVSKMFRMHSDQDISDILANLNLIQEEYMEILQMLDQLDPSSIPKPERTSINEPPNGSGIKPFGQMSQARLDKRRSTANNKE